MKLSVAVSFLVGLGLGAVLLAQAAPVTGFPNAHKDGIIEQVDGASETLLAARGNRQAWCVRADPDNTGTVHVRLAAAAATTSYMELDAGQSYCEPIGGDQVYTGEVRAIGSAAGQNVHLIEY